MTQVDLPVAAEWFSTADEGEAVLRLWEPRVRGLIRSNIFVIQGRCRYLVVDSGCGIAPLMPYLPPMRTAPEVIATHAHFDHVGGWHEFGSRLIHRTEGNDVAQPDPLATLSTSRLPPPIRNDLGPTAPLSLVTAVPWDGYQPEKYARRPAPPTTLVDDGDVIDLGDRRLEVLHFPGHSPGSICLYEAETKTLLSGDVIYDGGLIDDGIPGTSKAQYLTSMERLLTLNLAKVLPGHGPTLSGEQAQAIAAGYLAQASGRPTH